MATSYLSYDVHTVTVTFRHASLEIGLLTLHCTSRYLHYSPIELMYNIGSSNQFGSIRTYSIRHLRPPLCPIARKTESPTTTPPALPSSKGPFTSGSIKTSPFLEILTLFPGVILSLLLLSETSYYSVGSSPLYYLLRQVLLCLQLQYTFSTMRQCDSFHRGRAFSMHAC